MIEPLLGVSKQTIRTALRLLGIEVTRVTHRSSPPVEVLHRPANADNLTVHRLQLDNSEGFAWPKRPIAFALVSSNHGTLIINRNDYRMFDEVNGFGLGFQILNSACYNYEEVKLLLSLLSNRRRFYGDGVIGIDCGANCGIHTVEWSRHMFGWGKVIAIEAQERIYYALCGNIAINNCMNAKAILAAVGNDTREISIPSPNYLKPASFGSLELRKGEDNEFIGQKLSYREEDCERIPQITIDSLDLDRVDLLKIDVEGMEADVLEGAQETIKKHTPQLCIEWIKSNADAIKGTLAGWGYRYFIVGENLIAIHNKDGAGNNISMKDGILHIGRVL